ncbi:MAG: hypothetical protein J3R72DRAFT_420991 [Linnemannia gamsii]|nr:MAG: hypothetical protein J3R72DRAFT_420991 [Linnemannia gamsii]
MRERSLDLPLSLIKVMLTFCLACIVLGVDTRPSLPSDVAVVLTKNEESEREPRKDMSKGVTRRAYRVSSYEVQNRRHAVVAAVQFFASSQFRSLRDPITSSHVPN